MPRGLYGNAILEDKLIAMGGEELDEYVERERARLLSEKK